MKHIPHEILDKKITIHDSRHFEVKVNLDLPDARVNSYEIDTFIFVPRALNIGPSTYSKSEFYGGIQKYIRFKTPQIDLDRITDPTIESSPWNRIMKGLEELVAGSITQTTTDAKIDSIFEETKLLGQVIRVSLRDVSKDLLDEIEGVRLYPGTERIDLLRQGLKRLLDGVRGLSEAMNRLRHEIGRPPVPAKLKYGFRYLDEFFSLTVEDYLALIFKGLTDVPAVKEKTADLQAEFGAVLVSQQAHRKEMGYPSVIVKGTDNSSLPYRKGVLKKFSSSSLHLNLEAAEWETRSQLNFSIAAGLAMLFAAVVTVIAQSRFSTTSSMFILIVVVSYILKDRMKDWLKVFLSKRMLRGAADQRSKIRDPGTGQVLGLVREAFAFLDLSKVPPSIRVRRNMDNITSIDEEGKPERVMKYEKQVTLYPKRISRFHQRRRDISDIMRFDVNPWLKNADDPRTEALYFDPETKQLETVTCTKVYHVNIVFRYQALDHEGKMHDAFERVRLVLNRDGIVSLEEVV